MHIPTRTLVHDRRLKFANVRMWVRASLSSRFRRLKFAISPLKVRDFATLTRRNHGCMQRAAPLFKPPFSFYQYSSIIRCSRSFVLPWYERRFYQKANARVNVLSLEEEADNDHLRAAIKDLHSQEDNLIPQVNYLNALEAGKSLSMG